MMGCLWDWRGVFVAGIGTICTALPVMAADYDNAYRTPRPPRAMAERDTGPVLDPRCRIVPMPEANLFLDTTRFRPTLICMSRGMIADSYGAPYGYPYYSR